MNNDFYEIIKNIEKEKIKLSRNFLFLFDEINDKYFFDNNFYTIDKENYFKKLLYIFENETDLNLSDNISPFEIYQNIISKIPQIGIELNKIYPNWENKTFKELKELEMFPKAKFPIIYEKVNHFQSKYRTIFSDLFLFLGYNSKKCDYCKDNKHSIGNCNSTILEVDQLSNKNNLTIQELLEIFYSNKQRLCQNCQRVTKICQNYNFNNPQILFFHLTKSNNNNEAFTIHKVVVEEEINLSHMNLSGIGPKKYRLYALIYKENPYNNNYITFIKDFNQEKWYKHSYGIRSEFLYKDILNYNANLPDAIYIGV